MSSLFEETTFVVNEWTEEFFSTLIAHLPDAVVFADRERRIDFVNDRFVELFGYDFDEIAGRKTRKLYAEPKDYEEAGRQRFNNRVEIRDDVYILDYRTKNGRVFPGETCGVPVRNALGETLGFVGVIRDHTAVVKRDCELREIRDTLRRRLARTQLFYELSTRESEPFDEVVCCALETACKLFEADVAILSKIDGSSYQIVDYWSRGHVGLEAGTTFELGQTYCSLTLESGSVFCVDHMGESPHAAHPCYEHFALESYIGAVVEVGGELFGTINFSSTSPRERPYSKADEEFIKMLATWLGLFATRSQTEEQLVYEHEAMTAALDLQHKLQSSDLTQADTARVFVDLVSKVVDVNGLAVALHEEEGVVVAAACGSFTKLVGRALPNQLVPRSHSAHCKRASLRSWQTSRDVRSHADPTRVAELAYSGTRLGVLLVAPARQSTFESFDRNVLELTAGMLSARLLIAASYERVHREATTDALTGLANRRETLRRLEQASDARPALPLHLALLDVDRFKQVNDTYGHSAGDRVLQRLARTLQRTLGNSAIAGRLGGEEFVVGLRALQIEAALEAMNAALEAFSAVDFADDKGNHFSVTFSAGLTRVGGQDTIYDALSRADELLYRAKRTGRARVISDGLPLC
jgi:diguanylate cyclase (GGDEF)-like protein/PAS domain S-box-containing protein